MRVVLWCAVLLLVVAAQGSQSEVSVQLDEFGLEVDKLGAGIGGGKGRRGGGGDLTSEVEGFSVDSSSSSNRAGNSEESLLDRDVTQSSEEQELMQLGEKAKVSNQTVSPTNETSSDIHEYGTEGCIGGLGSSKTPLKLPAKCGCWTDVGTVDPAQSAASATCLPWCTKTKKEWTWDDKCKRKKCRGCVQCNSPGTAKETGFKFRVDMMFCDGKVLGRVVRSSQAFSSGLLNEEDSPAVVVASKGECFSKCSLLQCFFGNGQEKTTAKKWQIGAAMAKMLGCPTEKSEAPPCKISWSTAKAYSKALAYGNRTALC